MRTASALGRTLVTMAFVVVTGAGLALLALIRKLTMCTTHSTIHRSVTRQRRMAYLRGNLLEKRQRLLERMQAELAENDEPLGLPNDPVDIACSISARETSYEVGTVESDTIGQIDYVLRKIDSGQYGICDNCGKRISTARLRAIPFACLCVACKTQEEQQTHRRVEEDSTGLEDLASVLDARDGGEEEIVLGAVRAK